MIETLGFTFVPSEFTLQKGLRRCFHDIAAHERGPEVDQARAIKCIEPRPSECKCCCSFCFRPHNPHDL